MLNKTVRTRMLRNRRRRQRPSWKHKAEKELRYLYRQPIFSAYLSLKHLDAHPQEIERRMKELDNVNNTIHEHNASVGLLQDVLRVPGRRDSIPRDSFAALLKEFRSAMTPLVTDQRVFYPKVE